MFPGHSVDRAFRPSRCLIESDSGREADNSVERDTRIRAYARRVQMRLPLFEDSPVGLTCDEERDRD